jgi:crossover junction endodeoxyribonuclease RusA
MTERRAEYKVTPSVADTVTLPWPDHDLSPNARLHYMTKAAKAKDAHFEGRLYALDARLKIPKNVPLQMIVVFRPPSRRHYDMDNLLASCKNTLDGMFAVCDVDDSAVKRIIMDMDDVKPFGEVIVTIKEMI